MTSSGRFVEVQATAEQTPFEEVQMARLLELARGGIRQLLELQQGVLKQK
jgi:ribonuclease PH